MKGAQSFIMWVVIIVVGALLGSFIGGGIGYFFPDGIIHDLFAKEVAAGLQPATLDLRLVELTFGCVLKFNVSSVVGIIVAAILFRSLSD